MVDFAGRAELLALVHDLVLTPTRQDEVRPVLVVHGHGGSGRTQLLQQIRDRWAGQTPIAWVAGSWLPEPSPQARRPLLSTLMLELIARVPRYEPISFDRVTLAHVAMTDPITTADPRAAIDEMQKRISDYRPSAALALLRDLLGPGTRAAVTVAAQNDSAGAAAGEVAEKGARALVPRLERSGLWRRLTFGSALRWFAGDDTAEYAGERALLRLGRNAAALAETVHDGEPDVAASRSRIAAQEEIENLLVRAFLADVTASAAAMPQRPVNPVLLLDDADRPDVIAFLCALIRIRRDATADPLTVIATSSGQLLAALRAIGRAGYPIGEVAAAAHDLTPLSDDGVAGRWVSVPLAPLSADDTHRLAARPGYITASVPPDVVGEAVHRIAAGHPAATETLLRAVSHELRADTGPRDTGFLGRLHSVLTGPAEDGPGTVEEALLEQMVGGLHSEGAEAREMLVTLSAAHTVAEAEGLVGRSGDAAASDVQLLDVAAMWVDPPWQIWPEPPHFLRYLLLRRLAARRADGHASWVAIHTELRDRAIGHSPTNQVAWLHHRLALGELGEVGEALEDLLADLPGEEWLAVLDHVTAVPALHGVPDRSNGQSPTARRVIGLVVDWQLARDPRCDPQQLESCLLRVAREYEYLSSYAVSGIRAFLTRADLARRRARGLG